MRDREFKVHRYLEGREVAGAVWTNRSSMSAILRTVRSDQLGVLDLAVDHEWRGARSPSAPLVLRTSADGHAA